MASRSLLAAALGVAILTGCQSSDKGAEREILADATSGVNPYLWRASLDTFEDLPVTSADPVGGLIIYDWKSFEGSPDERIKATVYILDTRLRADGVKVSVFRQVRKGAEWADAPVSADTTIQLENSILARARGLKVAEIS